MKKITETELKKILDQHALWLESGNHQGKQAILEGANLEGARLYSANLEGANLVGANLIDANLVDANLKGAYLVGANLVGANLIDANLVDANLKGAYLEGTILEKKEKTVRKDCASVAPSFGEELQKLLDKHGVKLAGPLEILPK
jgi:uncharacterized protein YjbI with pentapeptide repeats